MNLKLICGRIHLSEIYILFNSVFVSRATFYLITENEEKKFYFVTSKSPHLEPSPTTYDLNSLTSTSNTKLTFGCHFDRNPRRCSVPNTRSAYSSIAVRQHVVYSQLLSHRHRLIDSFHAGVYTDNKSLPPFFLFFFRQLNCKTFFPTLVQRQQQLGNKLLNIDKIK